MGPDSARPGSLLWRCPQRLVLTWALKVGEPDELQRSKALLARRPSHHGRAPSANAATSGFQPSRVQVQGCSALMDALARVGRRAPWQLFSGAQPSIVCPCSKSHHSSAAKYASTQFLKLLNPSLVLLPLTKISLIRRHNSSIQYRSPHSVAVSRIVTSWAIPASSLCRRLSRAPPLLYSLRFCTMSNLKRKAATIGNETEAKKPKANGSIASFFGAVPKPAGASPASAPSPAAKFDKAKWVEGLTAEQKELLQLEIETLHDSWLALLKDDVTSKEFLELKKFLNRETVAGRKWFPPKEDVYSW